jgi:hypothetical protein
MGIFLSFQACIFVERDNVFVLLFLFRGQNTWSVSCQIWYFFNLHLLSLQSQIEDAFHATLCKILSLYICMRVYVYVCIHIYVCIYMCVHICVCIYVCVYTYVCICVCIHMSVYCINFDYYIIKLSVIQLIFSFIWMFISRLEWHVKIFHLNYRFVHFSLKFRQCLLYLILMAIYIWKYMTIHSC